MKNYIIAILLAIFAIPSFGQSISIFDIDTTNFPTMKAKFYAFDKDGKYTTPNISDLQLTENGINRTITGVSCPPPVPPQALSSVLVIDVSGSMWGGYSDIPNIELAKKAATAWVNALPLGQSECAITTFDHLNYLNQDFTKNKTKLLNAISTLSPQGGTDYNAALINQMSGGLLISNKAKNKKVIVLLTDGFASDPQINTIITEAKNQNCTIFCITLGMKAPQSLNDIASGTGGQTFENVTTINEAEESYRKILNITLGVTPCEVSWISDYNCNSNNTNLELTWQSQKSFLDYVPSNNAIAKLNVYPNFIAFGKRQPKAQYDTLITLTALKADVTINRINLKYGSNSFSIINSSFPITIPKNTSKEITLRFSPKDSSLCYESFEIETDKCSAYFSAYGGFPGKKSNSSTNSLKLTHPNGNETFVVGSDTLITWTGVSPSDTVTLEYSIDSGKSWKLVAEKATGLKFVWKNIPLPSSIKCLIKVKFIDRSNISNDFQILKGHTKQITDIAYSIDGSIIATTSIDNTAKIWDARTGNLLYTLSGYTGYDSGISFSPVTNRVATFGFEDKTIKIWDYNTGLLIKNLTGHTRQITDISYSPDGKQIAISSDLDGVKLWDSDSGTIIKTFSDNANYLIHSLAFSPDGSKIATIEESNGTIAKIWDINTGKVIRTLIGDGVINIKYNPDGSQIAAGCRYNGEVKIWDANNGTIIKTLKNQGGFIVFISFSHDGSLIATGGGFNDTLQIWNVNTWNLENKIITGFVTNDITGFETTNNTIVEKIVFSPDGKNIASILTDLGRSSIAIIWNLDKTPLLQDISDSVFSIVAPSPQSQNVDMKQCIVGASKDSLISTFMINNGTYQYRVDSIAITGANASEFRLVSGTPPFVVPANANRAVEFNFKPTSVGIRTAQLTIYTPSDTLYQTIQGEGIAPQLEIVNNLIDFGSVDIGQIKDTIQVVTIKNVGSAALSINNSLHLGPNDIDFATLSGAAPFSLNAGEISKMNLRFTPKAPGRTSGRLQFEFNGAGSPAIVQLFGTGLGGTATVNIGSDSAYTEEQVEIPVNILANNKLLSSGVTAISFELEMNKTILFPIGVNSTIDGENRIIKFDSVPIKNVGVNEVAKLKFIATLGNAEESGIRVRNIIPIGNDADFDVIDGNFKLLGVCKEGGERFLSSSFSQTKLLSIAPNPATESIEIEYSNADEGTAEIIISNYLGQTILTQKLEKTQTGSIKLDLSLIPTGQYFIQFKTETVLENKMIQVIK